jgi:hypothetical protein
MGDNKIPGNTTEQSLYRAKLVGITGILAIVNCLVEVHNITRGTSNVGLNSQQAMLNVGGDWPLKPGQPDFDILQGIRPKIIKFPLYWSFFWIESHQDSKGKSLNSWALLFVTVLPKHLELCQTMSGLMPANQRFGDEDYGALAPTSASSLASTKTSLVTTPLLPKLLSTGASNTPCFLAFSLQLIGMQSTKPYACYLSEKSASY